MLPVFYAGPASCESVFKLSDLSGDQRAELFTQVGLYGELTALLNYCQRPPDIIAKLTPIVQGCVEEESFAAVKDRYNTAVVNASGRYECVGPGARKKIPEFEDKIARIISGMATACRLRSFYRLSFPKINPP